MSYHSFRVNGSTTFFLIPRFPFDRRLFLPTALRVSVELAFGSNTTIHHKSERRRDVRSSRGLRHSTAPVELFPQ